MEFELYAYRITSPEVFIERIALITQNFSEIYEPINDEE
jgi:hypothetical protein